MNHFALARLAFFGVTPATLAFAAVCSYLNYPTPAIISLALAAAYQVVVSIILRNTIAFLMDDPFLYVPKVLREVNGKPSAVGVPQPPFQLVKSLHHANAISVKFIDEGNFNRPDYRPGHKKVLVSDIRIEDTTGE